MNGRKLAAPAKAQEAQPAAPKAQSLLEFIASKGGLGPDAELAAIGGEGHTVNIEGIGRRKLVRQGGWPLDYAREAAEEAGYLRGNHNGTSTVNDLLDAIDAEMRGAKRFPEGFEGHVGKREAAARSERETHEHDAFMRGIDEDLTAAGHGELGPEVKERAARLMANERMDADTAVENAFRQLEQEDAAGVARGGGLPGRSAGAGCGKAAAAPEAAGSGFTMRDVEQVRKQLSTLYGDARRAMMGGGSGADLHALEQITDHFDARVAQMIEQGKFAGDGPAVLRMQEEARAAFADYKQKFAKRGADDEVGAAVEKILGKFSDTKATPDTIVRLAYGTGDAPGGQMPVQIAQRIERIFGRNSDEFATYKQGLFSHLRSGEPEKAAARIVEFLKGTKGRLLSQTVFDPNERAALARYADRLRGVSAPQALEPGAAAAAIRRYSGADGAPPASGNQIVNDLFGATGKGNGRFAVDLAVKLKQSLTPEGFTAVRQGMWEKLVNAGEGKIEFEAQALSQRLHDFLNESGSQLAKVLYLAERAATDGAACQRLQANDPGEGDNQPQRHGADAGKDRERRAAFAVAAARLLRWRPAWRGGGVWRRQGIDGDRQCRREAEGGQSVLWAASRAAGRSALCQGRRPAIARRASDRQSRALALMSVIQTRGAVHRGDRNQGAGEAEIVDDAVSYEPDAKHGDGKNQDADQD